MKLKGFLTTDAPCIGRGLPGSLKGGSEITGNYQETSMEVEIPRNMGKRCRAGLRRGYGIDGEFGCEESSLTARITSAELSSCGEVDGGNGRRRWPRR